jgi:predicted RNA binding protein YcfA (HicA-like mRNA interferase family)
LPKRYPSLTPSEVIDILTARKFTFKTQNGSHAQYEGIVGSITRKVTVDMAEKDFGRDLIQSMIRQSGLSRNDFYCSTKKTAKKINRKPNI